MSTRGAPIGLSCAITRGFSVLVLYSKSNREDVLPSSLAEGTSIRGLASDLVLVVVVDGVHKEASRFPAIKGVVEGGDAEFQLQNVPELSSLIASGPC